MTEELQTSQETTEIIEHDLVAIDAALFSQLTKRNQQFLLSVDKNLIAANLTLDIRHAIYTEMTETLIEGQTTGQTARQLYGTPTECAAVILKQQFPTMGENAKSPDWQIGVDGALILGSIFTIMSGISLMGGSKEGTIVMGIITLILNYLVAGFVMLRTAKAMPNMNAPKGERGYVRYFTVSIVSMLLWVAVIVLSLAFIPPQINVILPAEMYLIIGGATLALRFYLKKKWNIKGGLF